MGTRRRKPSEDSHDDLKDRSGTKRPADTALKQQRLKAWQPIFTPRAVLPIFFVMGLLFGGIGALLIWGSGLITEISLDYTMCERSRQSNNLQELAFSDMPTGSFNYLLSRATADLVPSRPQYAFVNDSTVTDLAKQAQCIIEFDVPADLPNSVLMYYKLVNFYQNHRGYYKSLDADQLKGQAVSPMELESGKCAPLASVEDGTKAIYPCGYIANSMFNDSFSDLTPVDPAGTPYVFSEKDIAWSGEATKYAATTAYSLDSIVPPPNWQKRYPDGYTAERPPPNLKEDEHFHNWMRTAGLPNFSKLYKRNDKDVLRKGRYRLVVDLNFPVIPYHGTKSVILSTVSWMGGKNPVLGFAYGGASVAFLLVAVLGTLGNCIRPRKLGDASLLSWNRVR